MTISSACAAAADVTPADRGVSATGSSVDAVVGLGSGRTAAVDRFGTTALADRAVPAAVLDRAGTSGPAPAATRPAPAVTTTEVGGLPSELVVVDEAMRAALRVAGRADEWPAPLRAEVLAWAGRLRDVLAAVEAKVLTAERDAGTWVLRGDRDLAGFVGRTSRTGRGAGVAAVGQAGTLAAMPVVAEALVDGPVTTTHVAQITRATAASPALAAELASPAGQAELVALAGRLDGSEFGKALAQLSASLDPASRQRAHDEQRANRSFAWTHTPSGTLLKGRLDSVAGHQLAKAIDALCPRPTLDDDRSREMRQADALLTLVERAAADRTTTPGALAPVQAILTLTQDTWTALRAARDQRAGHRPEGQVGGTSGTVCNDAAAGARGAVPGAASPLGAPDPAAVPDAGPGAVPGSAVDVLGRLRGAPAVTDETGQSWPASEIARALCDCALTRAVLGTRDGELNLGRESRAFRRQHWLALYAAGVTGCQIAGCGIPLAYCQLHHIAWWQRDGGLTNLANCAAYCSFHHHEIHRLGIVVTRRADGTLEHHHPDGRPYGGAPHGGTATPGEAMSPPQAARLPPEPTTVPTNRTTAGTAPPGRPPRSDTPGTAPPPLRDTGGGMVDMTSDTDDPPTDLLDLLTG